MHVQLDPDRVLLLAARRPVGPGEDAEVLTLAGAGGEGPVVFAWTSPRRLVAAVGEAQPWVAVRAADVIEHVAADDQARLVLDNPGPVRLGPDRLGEPEGAD